MDNQPQTIPEILLPTLSVEMKETDWEVIKKQLIDMIHKLIETDFHRLLTILYQIDVSEEKIRELLKQKDQLAGEVIADLIIERQKEKIGLRKKYSEWKNSSQRE